MVIRGTNAFERDRAQSWAQNSAVLAVTGANCLDCVNDSESITEGAKPLLRSTKPLPEAGVRVEWTTVFEPAASKL